MKLFKINQLLSSLVTLKATSITLRFILCIAAGFGWLVAMYIASTDWPSDSPLSLKLSIFSRFYTDALVVGSVGILLFSQRLLLRYSAYLLVVCYFFIQVMQYQSYRYTKTFIPQIAVENAGHISLLNTQPLLIGLGGLILAVCLSGAILSQHKSSYLPFYYRAVLAFVFIIAAVIMRNDHKWLSPELVVERTKIFNTGTIGFKQESPTGAFFDVMSASYLNQLELSRLNASGNRLSEREQDFIVKHSISWAEQDPEFPMVKTTAPETVNGITTLSHERPNVIVIFAEGVSARTIQPYSQKFPQISPNIESFAKSSIRINNYYNHTFATYRGLSGQHCSSFPHNRLLQSTEYRCLSHILNDYDYSTEFMISQSRSETYLDEMLSKLGFTTIYAFEDLADEDTENELLRISDQALFEKLITNLKHREAQQTKPFYIGLYTFETHTGVRLGESGMRYPQIERDENSYVLDTIYNLDSAFGKFWQYFQKSPFAKNTIVVFTSDHAHFPDANYRSFWTSKERYTPVFVDRIPLIIHSPFHQQDREFELKHGSSLDFAPTLLDLLGIKNYQSAFFGQSLFRAGNRMVPVAMGNQDMWYINNGTPWLLDENQTNPNYATMSQLIKRTQALELNDRLWPKNQNP